MKIGPHYFFKKILKSNDNRTIYISYLYDRLASVKPAGEWLRIYFKDSKRGKNILFFLIGIVQMVVLFRAVF